MSNSSLVFIPKSGPIIFWTLFITSKASQIKSFAVFVPEPKHRFSDGYLSCLSMDILVSQSLHSDWVIFMLSNFESIYSSSAPIYTFCPLALQVSLTNVPKVTKLCI